MGLVIGEIWTYKATKPSDNLEKIRPVLVIGDDGDNGLEFVDINYVIISSSASCGKYDVEINEEIFKGMTSVGNNPTVNGIDLTIETYILDFNDAKVQRSKCRSCLQDKTFELGTC